MASSKAQYKVAILGQTGQVSTYLQRALHADKNIEVLVVGRDTLDLSAPERIATGLAALEFDLLINAAAFTAVDLAETEQAQAFAINRDAVQALATYCASENTPLIHYSTDYVFPGDAHEPYVETDQTGPTGVYGLSKLAGEQAVLASGARALILRTAWVYSNVGKNFYKTMLGLSASRKQLNVVNDQVGSPTYAGSIADATRQLALLLLTKQVRSDQFGVYHLTSQGQTHWAGFAEALFRANGIGDMQVQGIPSSEYPTPAKRPAYSVLSGAKLADQFGIALPNWLDALHECAQATVG